jgi:SET domain-containing protein
MSALPGLRVVDSGIHGYGVVATRRFEPGEVVAVVDGVLWHVDQDKDDTYSLWLDDDWYFDMVDQTRYINHSCDPNSEVEAGLEGGGWGRIVALRAIEPGEEVTYDYGFDAANAEPCACGARACRGYIVDAAELPRLRELVGAA